MGVYSAFVLRDDGTWTQPRFRLTRPATEAQIKAALTRNHHNFYVTGLQGDDDTVDEFVGDLQL